MFANLPELESLAFVAAAAAVLAALTWALTGIVRRRLIDRDVLDRPNARSSHDQPVPRGGGIAIMALGLPAAAAAGVWFGAPVITLVISIAGAVLLAALGLADDVRGLPVLPRLAGQVLAVVALVVSLLWMEPMRSVEGWRLLLAVGLTIGLLWFVNLYNFMDGIDGISAVQTISLAIGIAAIDLMTGVGWLWPVALVIAGATAGFAVWNWAPAKIFLGDVGSVPLGFLMGALLVALALSGSWAAALILPGYYLADASLTMTLRLARGEKPWRPHREHFYQKAVQRGLSHAAVSRRIGAINAVLIGCAIVATVGYAVPALVLADLCVAMLLVSFADGKR